MDAQKKILQILNGRHFLWFQKLTIYIIDDELEDKSAW